MSNAGTNVSDVFHFGAGLQGEASASRGFIRYNQDKLPFRNNVRKNLRFFTPPPVLTGLIPNQNHVHTLPLTSPLKLSVDEHVELLIYYQKGSG